MLYVMLSHVMSCHIIMLCYMLYVICYVKSCHVMSYYNVMLYVICYMLCYMSCHVM